MTVNFINGTAAFAVSTTTAICNVPSGVQDNDQLLMFVVTTGGTGITVTLPGGWTSILNVTDGTNMRVVIASRIASSEPASYTSTLSGTASAAGGNIVAIRGQDLVSAVENSSSNVNTAGTTVTALGVTAITDGDFIQFFAVGTTASPSYTPPSGMTERVDSSGTTLADKIQAAAGGTGNQSATGSLSARTIAILVAVKPRLGWYMPLMGVG